MFSKHTSYTKQYNWNVIFWQLSCFYCWKFPVIGLYVTGVCKKYQLMYFTPPSLCCLSSMNLQMAFFKSSTVAFCTTTMAEKRLHQVLFIHIGYNKSTSKSVRDWKNFRPIYKCVLVWNLWVNYFQGVIKGQRPKCLWTQLYEMWYKTSFS